MKEVIISTEAVNSYGTRVLTSGIDTSQFERNPVLLWMHRRSWEPGAMPIGRIENLRTEGDRLIGTPVFDQNDPFAKQIESKWENGFLRMASAGLMILETSSDPAFVLAGQARETVTRSVLEEVSIVDIGGNDEALQLWGGEKLLKLAAGEESPALPLLPTAEPEAPEETPEHETTDNPNNNNSKMTKEQLQLLGLAEGATDEQITAALNLMKTKADSADILQLAAVTQTVDQAIADRKILAEQRDQFIKLGKSAGAAMLADTFKTMPQQMKPTDTIQLSKETAPTPGAGQAPAKTYKKLGDVPERERLQLRKEQPQEYMRLYKEEYGVDCPPLN